MSETCVVGVDLGGTNVRACAYLHDGMEAGAKFINPSNAHQGADAVADAVAGTIKQALGACKHPIQAVGIAIPGHIDDAGGMVRWAPNFGQQIGDTFQVWHNVPLKSMIETRVGLPVHTGNDANLAALGEYRFGLGKNSAKCLVMITLGTGIGGGVIFSPDAVHGRATGPLMLLGGDKGGAELGHVCIDRNGPDAGPVAYGALESYCGTRALITRAQHKLRYGRKSLITDAVSGDFSLITPLILSQAADAGDQVALEVWTEMGEHLGTAMGGFINLFAPDLLTVAGQIAKAGEHILGPARRTARDVAIPTLYEDVNIVQAERVEDAGILGAAALALEALR